MQFNKIYFVVLSLIILFLVSSCSNSSTTSDSSTGSSDTETSKIVACDIVTKEDVSLACGINIEDIELVKRSTLYLKDIYCDFKKKGGNYTVGSVILPGFSSVVWTENTTNQFINTNVPTSQYASIEVLERTLGSIGEGYYLTKSTQNVGRNKGTISYSLDFLKKGKRSVHDSYHYQTFRPTVALNENENCPNAKDTIKNLAKKVDSRLPN